MQQRALGLLLGFLARVWIATLRLTLVMDPALASAMGKPWVLALWHGQQFALLGWKRRRPTVALVSLSRDGDLEANALAHVGLTVARGSSSRGGLAGLRTIVRHLRNGLDAAFAVDGPRGPRGVVRTERGSVGVALAAHLAGGVVVPMASACASLWVFARAWDRFELPLPFSRVAVVLGAPMEPIEASPAALGAALDGVRAVAERVLVDASTALPLSLEALLVEPNVAAKPSEGNEL